METPMKTAAIYARVSSDKQKEEGTIASQTAALVEFARKEGYDVPREWIFEDEGFSGASLVRPGLERLRDLAAEGQLHAVLVYAPDRLSRKYAYQILLMEEFARNGVETVFVKAPKSATPEDQLLLQFQGMIAEYERGPDSGTLATRQAPSRATGSSERTQWCTVRLSLRAQDR
jgi:site-specific DNA recombinase